MTWRTRKGCLPGALALSERIGQCHAFVISSPEYNASVPGPLKNAIDWVSRVRPQPFKTKHALLLSSSPSMIGGNRGLWALRVPLEHLGTRVYPDMFSLPRAHEGFTDDGRLAHPGAQERLAETVSGFMRLVCADVRFVCLHRRSYNSPATVRMRQYVSASTQPGWGGPVRPWVMGRSHGRTGYCRPSGPRLRLRVELQAEVVEDVRRLGPVHVAAGVGLVRACQCRDDAACLACGAV
ncbi:hypothetical protein SRIMM317S_05888 [Streptomyces rimosus subsp. rimosus]